MKVEFVESDTGCEDCFFFVTKSNCSVGCESKDREDGKEGYFIEIEETYETKI